MNEIPQRLVRDALAFHLGVEPEAIESTHRLASDWSLVPLDLVLILLRLEDLGHVEFPFQELEHVVTVEDLTGVVDRWMHDAHVVLLDANAFGRRGRSTRTSRITGSFDERPAMRVTNASRRLRYPGPPNARRQRAYIVAPDRQNHRVLIGLYGAPPLRCNRSCPRPARRKSPSTRLLHRRRRLS